MRILIVEDNFTSRRLMQALLSPFGTCDVAADGQAGVLAVNKALESQDPYRLICLDVMMPRIDGQKALKIIRKLEEAKWKGKEGAKVIMTSALSDRGNVLTAIREGCEAYLVKPLKKHELLAKIRELGLLSKEEIVHNGNWTDSEIFSLRRRAQDLVSMASKVILDINDAPAFDTKSATVKMFFQWVKTKREIEIRTSKDFHKEALEEIK